MEFSDALTQRLQRRAEARGLSLQTLVEQYLESGLREAGQQSALHVTAPVNALVEGIYQEKTTITDLLARGDFGLGTFNDLDGEMVVLDGTVYQLRSDGQAYTVTPDTRTPYACVNFFRADSQDRVDDRLDFEGLTRALDQMLPSPNMIYAIRIEGRFSYVRTRSVPRQDSYRPLVEVAREQPEFEFHDVEGVMAGFWTPTFMSSLTVPGYHLHFLTADRTSGGHLLACETDGITVQSQHLPRLEVGLPVSLDYLTAEFSRNLEEDLEEAESARD